MPGSKRLRCKKCGKQFTTQRLNRVNCYDCRPERRAQDDSVVNVDFTPPDVGEGSMESFTRSDLAAAGVLDSWQAMACIQLAKLIDSGKHGASGPAGTIKAHRDAMAVAKATSPQLKADVVTRIFAEAD